MFWGLLRVKSVKKANCLAFLALEPMPMYKVPAGRPCHLAGFARKVCHKLLERIVCEDIAVTFGIGSGEDTIVFELLNQAGRAVVSDL